MNFDNVLENEDGDVAGCMNYKPAEDPFDNDSEWAKVQLTRLTGMCIRSQYLELTFPQCWIGFQLIKATTFIHGNFLP